MGLVYKKPIYSIVGSNVDLVPLQSSHLDLTRDWRNRPEVRRWFKSSSSITKEQHETWYESYLLKYDDYVFLVFDKLSGAFVGQVSVYNIDQASSSAEVGRFITAPDCGEKGYFKAACQELLNFVFCALGINTVYLEVHFDNERAIKIYGQLGFVNDEINGDYIKMLFVK